MRLRTVAASLLLVLSAPFSKANVAEVGAPVPIYTEAELIKLIEQNKHLERVRADNCQLVEDIVARATRINLPAYEFLYGDMLAWGVCVEQDVELGLYYMENAAHQGLPAALEQLGRYYSRGTLVHKTKKERFPTFAKRRPWVTSMRVSILLNCCCVIMAALWITKMPIAGSTTQSLLTNVSTNEFQCCAKV